MDGPFSSDFGSVEQVLSACKSRLISTIAKATVDNTFITQEPDDAAPPNLPGLRYWTLSWGDGRFDQRAFAGGGREGIFDDANIFIGIYNGLNVDQPSRDDAAMLNARNGIPAAMQALVAVLAEWMPADAARAENAGLLLEPLRPIGYESPKRIKSNWMRARVYFNAKMRWEVGPLP